MADAEAAQFRIVKHAGRFNDGLRIEERLSHAHIDDIVHLAPDMFFYRRHLSGDLSRTQVAHKTGESRGAEGALQRTADLRRDACRQAVAVFHQHRFDRFAVPQLPKKFPRPIL
ncbi:hypothetical protein SDC9_195174 [bioreactor metagenome]|uniref:Uncharacterized protein n=1 Tax=bioreactor metagenome TaxID=1076179 RepID=A0A645I8B5_9ZZZZ